MIFPRPLASAGRQTAWLRGLLICATLLTMLASAPLWLSARPYPLLPIASWFPAPVPPWDQLAFSLALLSLVVAGWAYRPAILTFLVSSLFLALSDQARLQPWFYMYWVMLLLTLTKEATALTACRVALAAVYLWGGLQKFNHEFFDMVVPWFASPAANWLPEAAVTALQWLLASAPVIEVFIGVGLWFSKTRLPCLFAALTIHVVALLFLGPLGHGHNWIIWPWNIAVPSLAFVLFPRKPSPPVWQNLRGQFATLILLTLYCLLPILSYFGRWDSYLSFSLYSGDLTKADIFISQQVRDALPEAVHQFVKPTPEPYHQQLQGPYVVLTELWSDKILRVPPYPEARSYRNVARYLASFAKDPNDVRLVLLPRVGPDLFYRGSDLRPNAGIPFKD